MGWLYSFTLIMVNGMACMSGLTPDMPQPRNVGGAALQGGRVHARSRQDSTRESRAVLRVAARPSRRTKGEAAEVNPMYVRRGPAAP